MTHCQGGNFAESSLRMCRKNGRQNVLGNVRLPANPNPNPNSRYTTTFGHGAPPLRSMALKWIWLLLLIYRGKMRRRSHLEISMHNKNPARKHISKLCKASCAWADLKSAPAAPTWTETRCGQATIGALRTVSPSKYPSVGVNSNTQAIMPFT